MKNTKYNLIKSKLCFGPMSKNIVDAIIEYSNENNLAITLIPSRRQIEYNGGYVNNWTTETFTEYVKSKSNLITIQRDHGGPGQGLDDDDGYESLKYDCKYFDSIHIDPWKKYQNFEKGLKWTIELLNFCYNINPNLYFEVGTEEAIRKMSTNDIDRLLKELKSNLKEEIYNRIIFCVIQSGTSLKNGINTGIYEENKLKDMLSLIKKYDKYSKEHNGDYMDKNVMLNRYNNNLDAINIAPELGYIETTIILNDLKTNELYEKVELFFKICLESGKWKKWVDKDFNPYENKEKLIEICGHYVFSHPEFKNIKNIKDEDIKNKMKLNIHDFYKNSNIYFKKDNLRIIDRVHPPINEQLVDERLRLHRAERLEPFPNDFFNKFIKNISQSDFRYYPYTHGLRDKLSKKFNVFSNQIFLNNGSSENIRIFYDCFAIKDKNVIITNPCYPMHKIYAQLNESKIIEINYNKKKTIDLDELISKIDSNTSCIVLANPNSPVGDIINLENIKRLLDITLKFNIPLLIDEAYIEYCDQDSCIKFLNEYKNLIISRTFSKALGCAGLRIGYLIGNIEIMTVINYLIPTYEISSISCKFGEYILDNYNIVEEYIEKIKLEKKSIKKICEVNNIDCILNHINTIYIKPKNLDNIINYLKNENVLFRTRKLPFDDEDWLAIVLFPNFTKSNLFKEVINN